MVERRVQETGEADDVASALRAFPATAGRNWSTLGGGLINTTYAVLGEPGHVLQRVSPIFAPEIHLNILAVTERLRARGIVTPVLVETTEGALWHTAKDGTVWRVMTRVPGESHSRATKPALAESAGRLVGRWHAALDGLAHDFVAMRRGVHDTSAHLALLVKAIDSMPHHPMHEEVRELASRIFASAAKLPALPDEPPRPCHGDLKMDNVVFDGDEAVALVDLDTVGPMSLAHELGDAWRSWCNPRGEDAGDDVEFDLETFAASLEGLRSGRGHDFTATERRGLLHGVEWISLELSARFAADALFERYFGWDPERFPSRGAHNLVRARGQFALHEAVLRSREARASLLLAGG